VSACCKPTGQNWLAWGGGGAINVLNKQRRESWVGVGGGGGGGGAIL